LKLIVDLFAQKEGKKKKNKKKKEKAILILRRSQEDLTFCKTGTKSRSVLQSIKMLYSNVVFILTTFFFLK